VYRDFGFHEIIYKVATRPDKRIGSDESWDKAEQALMESLRASGCESRSRRARAPSTDRRLNTR
jgi:threonyl-tRNA synthetase